MRLLIALSILVIAGCSSKDQKASASNENPEVENTITRRSFGEAITADGASDISMVSEMMSDRDSLDVKLSGTIEKTCKMKGCWMTIKTGDSTSMRVTFKDYGFFVPKEGMEGKNSVFEGQLTKTVTSVEALRHYAQDEGKSAEEIERITEPKEEYAFVASGVLIEED